MGMVVDGSNLGGALGGRRGARDAPAVVARLRDWARGRRRAVVVFDGPADPRLADRYGGVELRWSGARSADEEILRLIAGRPRQWTVVTADRALAAHCRDLGARHVTVEEFLASLERPGAGRDRGAGGEEPAVDVADWEAWFRGGGSGGGSGEVE